jgi:hypothetical protein
VIPNNRKSITRLSLLIPSPGTPGEGQGEGLSNNSKNPTIPHPRYPFIVGFAHPRYTLPP